MPADRWSPRQLIAPALFAGCLLGPWSWGGSGCLISFDLGFIMALGDAIGAWKSLGINLWTDPPRLVAAALGLRLALAGWCVLATWCVMSALPGRRPRVLARTGSVLVAGIVGAQLLLHDLEFSILGLGLAAGCWTLGAAASVSWGLRGDPGLARGAAIVFACLGLARLLHPDAFLLVGGSLASILLAGVALRAARADPVAEASDGVLLTP